MKNYIITDQLNPNAVNARYGRPASDLGVDEKCFTFVAFNDEQAFQIFDEALENGDAGYSESNTRRINAKLWRTKDFFKGGTPLLGADHD